MGSLPRVSVVTGPKVHVPAAPLTKHMSHLANSDRIALLYSDEMNSTSVTYAELNARTNALARAISKRAKVSGTNSDGDYVIAICMQPTHNTIMTLMATWKAGAAYLPLDPTFPQARFAHILKEAEPALIIHDDTANTSAFTESGLQTVLFEELAMEASGLSMDAPQVEEVLIPATSNSIAIVMYTSGSTGVPKGVRLTYNALCNRLWWQFEQFPFTKSEVICVWKTALTFIDSVCEIFGPLLNGRTLLILSKETTRDPQKLVRILSENKVYRLVLVPTLLRSILMYLTMDRSVKPLQHLKLFVCSGEALTKEACTQFFKYFGDHDGHKLANFYGSTEVMADVTFFVLESLAQVDLYPTIPIGVPIYNSCVYLLDEEMGCVREGEHGEVWVAGSNLAEGYVRGRDPHRFVHNPHNTNPDFGRLYRTGDFALLHKDMILYAGRTDSQVKIRGHRVDMQEVDQAVVGIAGVDKSVVLCYGAESGNPEILAFVTLKPEVRMSSKHIETSLKTSLPHYMIPQVIEIENIPLLVNGKVDRQMLLKMYENTNNNDDSEIPVDIDYSGVEPQQMKAAKALFETVGEVLGRAARGTLCIRAGFYELGGNSLNSIYTITKLRDQGYFIDISDFLGAANLGEVLCKMSTDCNGTADSKELKFTAITMRDEHKQQVIDMIISSFYEKAELEQFLKHEIEPNDYAVCIDKCWSKLISTGYSVVLTTDDNNPVAVGLNFDARDEPEIDLTGGLAKIMCFLEYVEGSVRDTMLPEGKGTILHSFMMATADSLSTQDNVSAIRALEHATMRVAREKRFKGIFTTNTSPLTQQLGTDILGFQTLLDYQINEYVDPNGDRIFGNAPDDMRAIVCWKQLD